MEYDLNSPLKKILMSKTFGMASLVVLVLAIPLTILVAQQQQNIRQSAHNKEEKFGSEPSFGQLDKTIRETRMLDPKLAASEKLIVECGFDRLVIRQVNDREAHLICAKRTVGKIIGLNPNQIVEERLFAGFLPKGGLSGDIIKVEFYIDDILVNTEAVAPFVLGGKSSDTINRFKKGNVLDILLHDTIGFDTTILPDGEHILKVIVYFSDDRTATEELTFKTFNGSGNPSLTPTGIQPSPTEAAISPTQVQATATPFPVSPTVVPTTDPFAPYR